MERALKHNLIFHGSFNTIMFHSFIKKMDFDLHGTDLNKLFGRSWGFENKRFSCKNCWKFLYTE
jgi:hypothetical protein